MVVTRILGALAVSIALGGCSSLYKPSGQVDVGVDGEMCAGSLPGPASNLSADSNRALLAQAQFPSQKGGVCAAQVYAVQAPMVLYRVFDSAKPYSKLGGWWSLDKPTGTRESYRSSFAICPEWSNLDRVVSCEVRPGTLLVIGNTQSAVCQDGSTLPKTTALQVFVPNDGKAGIFHVGACSSEAVWPE